MEVFPVSVSLRIFAALLGAALLFSGSATAAQAVTDSGTADSPPALESSLPSSLLDLETEEISIVADSDDTFGDVRAQIVDQIGAEAAEEFITAVREKEAAGIETNLPLIEEDGQPPAVNPYAKGVTSIPILGKAKNDDRSWVMESEINHVQCRIGTLFCDITDKRTMVITIDPGATAVKVSFNQRYFPSTGKLGTPTYSIGVYRSQKNVKGASWPISKNSDTRYLSHPRMHGSSFIFTMSATYKLGGKIRTLSDARTGAGKCTDEHYPTCIFLK